MVQFDQSAERNVIVSVIWDVEIEGEVQNQVSSRGVDSVGNTPDEETGCIIVG